LHISHTETNKTKLISTTSAKQKKLISEKTFHCSSKINKTFFAGGMDDIAFPLESTLRHSLGFYYLSKFQTFAGFFASTKLLIRPSQRGLNSFFMQIRHKIALVSYRKAKKQQKMIQLRFFCFFTLVQVVSYLYDAKDSIFSTPP
jgi:hypothetical protein